MRINCVVKLLIFTIITSTCTISEIRNFFTISKFPNCAVSQFFSLLQILTIFSQFFTTFHTFFTISQHQKFTIPRFHNIISQFYFTTLLPRMISIAHFNHRAGFQFEVEIGGDIHRWTDFESVKIGDNNSPVEYNFRITSRTDIRAGFIRY